MIFVIDTETDTIIDTIGVVRKYRLPNGDIVMPPEDGAVSGKYLFKTAVVVDEGEGTLVSEANEWDGTTATRRRTRSWPPVEEVRDEQRGRLADHMRRVRDGGTVVNGIVIATTHQARQELAALAQRLAGTTDIQPAVTRSGARVVFDADTATAALAAVDGHIQAAVEAEYHHLGILEGLARARETAEYDFTADHEAAPWPATPE